MNVYFIECTPCKMCYTGDNVLGWIQRHEQIHNHHCPEYLHVDAGKQSCIHPADHVEREWTWHTTLWSGTSFTWKGPGCQE